MNEKLLNKIKNMPKVELHLHLDGSLNTKDIQTKYGLTNEQIKDKMIADEKCKDLNDYLKKFDYPISIMQTKDSIQNIVIALLTYLKSQNVIYVEIRFAPQFHTRRGLTQDEVVNFVVNAAKKVDIKCNFILCLMRGENNNNENYETVRVAKKYLGRGVCAVDLAGAEAIFKTKEYEEIFEYVKEEEIPFTIHAGEADGPESIKSAISFGTKRIGHGVRAIEDEGLVEKIIKKGITLEVCPTSNIQTCICNDYASHPIVKLYKAGVKTTINTDNMTVSNTTLEKEYTSLIESTDLKYEDLVEMNINSVNAAFITAEEKNVLINKIKQGGITLED
ncbi:MAG: adenosine deaminase [Clostridia bacterium]|nr:adenosine deaminase [Clostridia bacterium]